MGDEAPEPPESATPVGQPESSRESVPAKSESAPGDAERTTSPDVSAASSDTPGVSERAEGAIDRLLQSPALSWLADDIRPIEERYNNKPSDAKAANAPANTADGLADAGDDAKAPLLPPGARLPRPAPELEPEPEPPKRKPKPEPDPPDTMDKILDALIGSRPLRWAISLFALVLGLPAVLGIWVLDPITKTTHTLATDETSAGAVVEIVQCWHSEKPMVYAVELIETASDGTRRFETLGYANQKVWAGAELNVVGDDAFVDFPDGPLWARTEVSTQTALSGLRSIESADPHPHVCK